MDGPRSVVNPFSVTWRSVAPLSCLLIAGCDALLLDREPEVVHLEASSNDVEELVLVTSQWFVRVPNPDCPGGGCGEQIELIESDTSIVNLPFSRSYPFTPRLQFLSELYPVGSARATVAMKVRLDDEDWYDDSRQLAPPDENGERPTLRFVYEYTIARLPGS